MKSAARRVLDTSVKSVAARNFESDLRAKVVGQEEGIKCLVDLYQIFIAGLNPVNRPVSNVLFLGGTGIGKTRIVEAASEVLFDSSKAIIKVDCAEFQHTHEIAKLTGSPPGYLGFKEACPIFTNEALSACHKDGFKLSFVLFDEIEKASDALWQLLLGIMDKAILTLGDNRKVDFSKTVIFMTSNLGSRELQELNNGMGFTKPDTKLKSFSDRIEFTANEAARRRFSPEFMNRLDSIVTFKPLSRDHLEQILSIELRRIQERVLSAINGQFLFTVTKDARDFLLKEGTDDRYGARALKRTLEQKIVYPLANLLASNQTAMGDLIRIDYDGSSSGLTFIKEEATLESKGASK